MALENPRVKFYDILDTFKQQIVSLIENEQLELDPIDRKAHLAKIDRLYRTLLLIKSTNSLLAITFFHQYLFVPYGVQIMNQDEDFFLNHRHQILEGNDLGLTDLIEGVSMVYPRLDEINRKIIWKYVLALCKTADLALGQDLFERLKLEKQANLTKQS